MIELVKPSIFFKEAAENFKQEFFDNGEKVINGSALYDQMEYEKWLQNIEINNNPETVRKDWVLASTFFAVRKEDNKIVGIIDTRHNIKLNFLANYGGHIGYSVRPSERRKGYATQMLKLAMAFEKSIGNTKVMLGCYSDNVGSIRTIEKCGGILTENKKYLDGKDMKVYWIEL